MRLLLPLVSLLGVTLAADEVVTITAPAAIPSNEPEWKTDKTFTSAVLNSTDFYRGQHNASSLTWNRTLE
jgi:uncharacterized protein YkwD